MSYKDIDHAILAKAFAAQNVMEFAAVAASCGCNLSSAQLQGKTYDNMCSGHYDCFDLEIRF